VGRFGRRGVPVGGVLLLSIAIAILLLGGLAVLLGLVCAGGWGGCGRCTAGAGEGGVDFVLGEVFGAEEGEFLFDGGRGDGRVLED